MSVPLWRAPTPAVHLPLPVATTSLDEPVPEPGAVLVPSLRCSAGHPNNPAASHCAHCGRSLLDGTARLVERLQPTLGLLLLDDGSSYTLDAGYLIGCLPDLAISLSRGDVRPLVLPERDGVAATHAEVVLDGWAVTVTDRALDADTWVRRPGDREWVRLTHGRPEGHRRGVADPRRRACAHVRRSTADLGRRTLQIVANATSFGMLADRVSECTR